MTEGSEREGVHIHLHQHVQTTFDPARHVAAVPLEAGAEVIVRVPGLVDKQSRSVRIRALVEPITATATVDPAVTDGSEESSEPSDAPPSHQDGPPAGDGVTASPSDDQLQVGEE